VTSIGVYWEQTAAACESESHISAATYCNKLPTFADYEDLKDFHDLEQTEIAAYKAAKKFIW
jgi:hypothetical protein